MKCRFCESEATHACSFKLPEPRIVFVSEIEKLDLIRDDLKLICRPVKSITVNGGDYALIKLAGEKRTVIERHINVRLPHLRMELHACGKACCENHIREFDDDVLQCPEHWPGWDKVYGVD